MFLEDRFYQKVLKSNLKRKTNELTIMSLNFTTNKSFIIGTTSTGKKIHFKIRSGYEKLFRYCKSIDI